MSRRSLRFPARFRVEALEERCTPVTLQFDYRLDTTGFFTPAMRTAMNEAAATLGDRYTDQLAAIAPGSGNTYSADMFDPNNINNSYSVTDLAVPANTLIIFCGTQAFGSQGILAVGGPGSYSSLAGTTAFQNTVKGRTTSTPNLTTDFQVWGGAISIATDINWNLDPEPTNIDPNKYDLIGVVTHELNHAMGFIDSHPSFSNYVTQNATFVGPQAVAAFGGPVPLSSSSDTSHWSLSIQSDGMQPVMAPAVDIGQRLYMTDLDWAAMGDVGWQPSTDPNATIATATDTGIGPGLAEQYNPSGLTFDTGLDVDMYKFQAGAGDALILTSAGTSAPYLRLFDALGNELDKGTGSLTHPFATAGTFYVGASTSPNKIYWPTRAYIQAQAGVAENYTLNLVVDRPGGPSIVSIDPVTPNIRQTPVDSITVTFSEPLDLNTFDWHDLSLVRNGGSNLINSSVTITPLGSNRYQIGNLTGLTGLEGQYTLIVNAAGVTDVAGTPGTGSAATSWTVDISGPTVVAFGPVSPNPRNTPLDSVVITFDKPVDLTTFGPARITLTRNGVVVGPGYIDVTPIGGNSYRLGRISTLTTESGNYTLTVDMSRVSNLAGTLGSGTASVSWTEKYSHPTVTVNQAATQADPTKVPSIVFTVTFSEPVTGFAAGGVSLAGSAGATTATISGSGANYSVTVTGLAQAGTVTMYVAAGAAFDNAGNGNLPSTSNDNTATYNPDPVPPPPPPPASQPPLLDLNGSDAGVDYSGTLFIGRGPAPAVAAGRLLLADFDSALISGAKVVFTARPDGTAETVTVDTVGTGITASFNSATGTLTLTGPDTVLNYQRVLRSLTYTDSAANPTLGSGHTLTVTVTDDSGTPSSAGVTMDVETPARVWVRQLYAELLGRAPNVSELTAGAAALGSGTSFGEVAAQVAAAGTEYISRRGPAPADIVIGLYRDLLGRSPTSNEWASGTALYASGGVGAVARKVTGSAEFTQLVAQAGFVQSLYQDVLGRLPAMSEWLFWAQKLRQGSKPADLATAFLTSAERYSEYVTGLYATILGRAPSSAEVDAYVASLQSGVRQETIEAGFYASPEYFARSGGTNTGYVQTLYRQLLGRAPAAFEQNFWLDQLTSNGPRSAVAFGFVASSEFRTGLEYGWHDQYLKRPGDPAAVMTWVEWIATTNATREQAQFALIQSAEYTQGAELRFGIP